MTDTLLQRKNMVESQVRPSDVTDRRIMTAMLEIPRERFVPAGIASLDYMDEALSVAPGRSLMAPRDFARLVQLAGINTSDKVLIVGALSGYSSAVVSRLAQTVVAIESDVSAVAAAKAALIDAKISNVTVETGQLSAGWSAAAPYDVIFVEGAVESVPSSLLDQLADAGRLVAVELDGGVGRAVVRQKTGNITSRRVAFEASAALLPGFERPRAFSF